MKGRSGKGLTLLARRLAAGMAALVALPAAGQETTEPAAENPPPAAFLFELPDEVKTGLMVVLAAAIAIYLWRNLSQGD